MQNNHEARAERAAIELREAASAQTQTSNKLIAQLGAGVIYALLHIADAIRDRR